MPSFSPDQAEAFRPVSRTTLNEQIHHQIKERLATGQFGPGQRLPLRTLAAALGVSPMPVRDALQRLESIGVLTLQSNRTMAVPRLDEGQLREIRDVRIALEGLAADYAARAADEADQRRLAQHLDALRRAARAGEASAFLQANWLFHRAIAQATHSDLILAMIEPLWLRMGPSIRLSKPDGARMIEALPCHEAIADALRERQGERARQAVVADITGCFEMLRLPNPHPALSESGDIHP